MTDQGIVVAGIPIPSSSPFFLITVGVHVVAGLVCVIAGAVAMLSSKRGGRHPYAGTVYFLASSGARRDVTSRAGWPRIHVSGMSLSYILLLTAFSSHS